MELSLKKSEEKYRLLFENAVEGIAVLQQGKIKIWNPMLQNMLKISGEELQDKNIGDLIYVEDRKRVEELHFQRVQGLKDQITEEFRIVRQDGSLRWLESKGIQITWNGSPASLNFLTDITERKETEKNILHLSYHDQLTGIYNRRFFEEELKRLDNPRNLPLSIVIVDVNGLKLFNDGFGHEAGDRLIITVAQLLDGESRGNDVTARIGGDEFVVMMPNTDQTQLKAFQKRFEQQLAKKNLSGIPISVSMGYATKFEQEMSVQDIFKRAEERMYRRKTEDSSKYKRKTLGRIMESVFDMIPWEKRHGENTAKLAKLFGEVMDYSDKEQENLKLAGYYHDIGKIGVDRKILIKNTMLEPEEMRVVERHPEVGYQLLNTTNETLAIAEMVLYHDEKRDGTGYPQGLKEEEIPKGARILSIVEVYENLIHDRPYQKALNPQEAKAIMVSEKGKAFDPELVDIFIEEVEKIT
ncbi:HD domain-containing phosphohydrolase [Isachenkonia alkalipeptolytica]|uniref:Diguanylate cyclase n=1 Tax=Isachenkonia alkalipeptolytica TaxID=2565777 RepID=A0AA44BCK2_9CLOT|nr:HD domain-containing phosphohydrolase [Isachenkonia alkalipeptolytica]NBG87057.1 diguanylate cyclase [Isachenkonia alkalipeptolytica]